ncbi:UNVERIFIED_CONTAM: hypothetical protein FKN15_017240 [Acipenser sinensis]
MDRHSRLCLLPEVVFRTGPWLFTAEAIISSRAAALGVCCHRPRSPSQGTIWRQCTTDIWVLTTIQTGYSLQFKHDPPPFQGVTPTSVTDLKNATVVPQEVAALLLSYSHDRPPAVGERVLLQPTVKTAQCRDLLSQAQVTLWHPDPSSLQLWVWPLNGGT